MKITPLEIRQQSFEKKLRGYDKDEVNAFLLTLSHEWEFLNEENKNLKIKLQDSASEVKKLREVESSLFKTLKAAEDTGSNMIKQANKAADLHLKETQISADSVLNEAKSKARMTIEEADLKARQTVEEMEDEVKALAQVYKSLENLRDNLLSDLTNLSNDTTKKVQRISEQINYFDLEEKIRSVRKSFQQESKQTIPVKVKKEGKVNTMISPKEVTDNNHEGTNNNNAETDSSFFDDLD